MCFTPVYTQREHDSPARAALTLVLDGGDGAIGDPVDGGGGGGEVRVGGLGVHLAQVGIVDVLVAEELGAELLLVHVGELVDGQLERLVLHVVGGNQVKVGLEVGEAHVELIDVVVLSNRTKSRQKEQSALG